jgi:beta-lactamase regulating signal transducer with metallopeptidase domain
MTTLALTLVHFLWQGTLATLAVAVFLRFGPRTASVRYAVGVAALGVMLVTPAVTYVALSRLESVRTPALTTTSGTAVAAGAAVAPAIEAGDSSVAMPPRIDRDAPTPGLSLVVLAWAAGVLMLSLRLVGGWLVARRLAARVVGPVSPEVLVVAARVSNRLGVRQAVRVLESSACAVPVVIGWVRPVVLLPLAALSGLPPAQIEALLAHELAHIRRHDYLVNLMQAAVETLLFYHPGVWWVSRQVRIEREHCCDDLAVSVCDRVEYASALSALATITSTRGLALAATDGPLLRRVRRLLGQTATARTSASLWFSIVTLVAVAALIPAATAAVALRPADEAPPIAVAEQVAPPSNPDAVSPPRVPLNAPPPSPSIDRSAPVEVPRPEASAGPAESPGADQVPGQDVEELERQLRLLAEERVALEREIAKEQHRAARAELTVRLENMRVALQEAKIRSEIGLAGISEVRDLEAQTAAVQRRVEMLDWEAQTRDAEVELLRRQEILQRQYERARQASSVLATESEGERVLRQSRWVAVSHGPHRGWFEARIQPYTQGGPAVFFPVAESDGARTADGRPISRIRFIGWREGEATRVIALVSVPRDDGANTYTTDASRLVERDAGTYLIRFGELLELKDLEALGISNVWISSVLPVR